MGWPRAAHREPLPHVGPQPTTSSPPPSLSPSPSPSSSPADPSTKSLPPDSHAAATPSPSEGRPQFPQDGGLLATQFSHWPWKGSLQELMSQWSVAGKQFMAGAAAGATAKTFIAPLDRTKILFQVSQHPFSLRAAFALARSVVREEGVLALYKGNLATVARVVPYSGVQLMAFDQYRRLFRSHRAMEPGARLPALDNLLAGSMAGATSVLLTYPLDLMRARLAVQRAVHKYESLGHAFRTAFQEEGIRGLYRGLTPTLVGILPYAGLSFFTFESSKNAVHDYTGEPITTGQRLLCGGLGGLVGQSATYPLDIARRRMQTESFILAHLRDHFDRPSPDHKSNIRHPPVANSGDAMATGLTMNWIKGPIAVGVSFTTFDLLKRKLGVHDGSATA